VVLEVPGLETEDCMPEIGRNSDVI
jgi:hypothetical protein